MKHPDPTLATPLYVKSADDMPWPAEESCFHLLTRDGLFICRNNRFFSSAVPAAAFPQALASQKLFCKIRYPKLPRRQFELIVGFFSRVAQLHQAEACVLLAWDEKSERYRLIVPKQLATCGWSSWEQKRYPVGVHYKVPTDLPPHCPVVASVHSHVDEPAYTSHVDAADERYRAGLHIIVGRISEEPPEIKIEAVIDGTRFRLEPSMVIEDYQRRRQRIPQEWMDRLEVEVWKPQSHFASSSSVDGSSVDDERKDRR
jgi:proteasome lid subunit RPN8/RPN11